MQKLTCQACAAALTPVPGAKTLTCDFCGTAFERPLEQVQAEQALLQQQAEQERERNMTATERMQLESRARQEALRERQQQEQAQGGGGVSGSGGVDAGDIAQIVGSVASGLGVTGTVRRTGRKLKLGCFALLAVAVIILILIIISRFA